MSFQDILSWGLPIITLGVWIWGLVTFFKTPEAGFATSLERTLMMYIVIFLGTFGALGWLFAIRPLVRSRLIELQDDRVRHPAEPWRRHLAP